MKTGRRKLLLGALAVTSTAAALSACKGGTPDKPERATASTAKKIN